MKKVDLTKKAEGGNQLRLSIKPPVSQSVSFAEVKNYQSILKKIPEGEIEVTEGEFAFIFGSFVNASMETKIAFAEMVEDLNEGFDIVEYEENLKHPK